MTRVHDFTTLNDLFTFSLAIVDSICNTFHIPHIMTHWTHDPIDINRRRQPQPNLFTINIYPDSDVMAAALADLIEDYDWSSYAIIYDTDESLYPALEFFCDDSIQLKQSFSL